MVSDLKFNDLIQRLMLDVFLEKNKKKKKIKKKRYLIQKFIDFLRFYKLPIYLEEKARVDTKFSDGV